ncbi:TetR/AcrR family transcriptional regulator [Pseudomonas syringae pv. syringae]|nr:transcriptional regulator, TetR family [Pseudomonas syringae pv. syringae B301D]AVB25855.1 TetR/AcrR family transcriptional regulator [Pseudomonas syringae pv. syringae]MCF5029090.1 TetR family transcriptional regulator [Pseudomonas syringae]MCF5180021.1 TetR family transcriptional regulator [Pseudomonas syringae]MCF5313191.1 TetR family transcriptional regulator [Pseudomonas syringae]
MTEDLNCQAVPGSPRWWMNRVRRVEKSRSRGRPSVSAERIIATALEAVDEVGAQAFNMRMLAERLESGTATLYRHFASKDEILVYVVDSVLGEMSADQSDAAEGAPQEQGGDEHAWQKACASGAERLYRVLRKHPGILPLLVSQIPIGPNGLKRREQGIALFLANGFPAELAARAYTSVAHYVLGFAIQQHSNVASKASDGEDLVEFFSALDADEYPAIAAAGRHLPGVSVEDEFRFGLQLIIDGLDLALAGLQQGTGKR